MGDNRYGYRKTSAVLFNRTREGLARAEFKDIFIYLTSAGFRLAENPEKDLRDYNPNDLERFAEGLLRTDPEVRKKWRTWRLELQKQDDSKLTAWISFSRIGWIFYKYQTCANLTSTNAPHYPEYEGVLKELEKKKRDIALEKNK